MKYTYEIEFMDEGSGQYFITDRTYDHEMEWEEIWQDVVVAGDLQMIPVLVSTEEDGEEDDEDEDN